MRKFNIEYRVYSCGSVYRGGRVVEAENAEDAKKKLMESNSNILSCEKIEEVKNA